jgi:hypothetical protein
MAESKFNNKVYVKVYIAAKEGCTQNKICHVLGVQIRTFKKWLNKYPTLQWAIDLARGTGKEKGLLSETFSDYVYGRLDKRTKRLWDSINSTLDEDPSEFIKDITRGKGKRTMQSLFVHALISCNFNASEACRKSGISRKRLDFWKLEPDFVELLKGVTEVKKDFVESALMGLISKGDSAATIFANSTLNRDRSYGKSVLVEHSGTVRQEFSIMDLPLPVDIKRMILTAIRTYKEQQTKQLEPAKSITVIPTSIQTEEEALEEL